MEREAIRRGYRAGCGVHGHLATCGLRRRGVRGIHGSLSGTRPCPQRPRLCPWLGRTVRLAAARIAHRHRATSSTRAAQLAPGRRHLEPHGTAWLPTPEWVRGRRRLLVAREALPPAAPDAGRDARRGGRVRALRSAAGAYTRGVCAAPALWTRARDLGERRLDTPSLHARPAISGVRVALHVNSRLTSTVRVIMRASETPHRSGMPCQCDVSPCQGVICRPDL